MMTKPAAAVPLEATLLEALPLHHLKDPEHSCREIAERWSERQRAWHGPSHLLEMLESILPLPADSDRETLLLTAVYHDVIYDPRGSDNEEASTRLLMQHASDPQHPVVVGAVEMIRASSWTRSPDHPLLQAFFDLDTVQLADEYPLSRRLAYERAIFQEYQWVDWDTYHSKRRSFLEGWASAFPQHRRGVQECIDLLAGLHPRIAVYPGSFAPFHLGHLSILRQAERIFDKVIVAVGINRQKPGAIESAAERTAELQARLKYHEVTSFTGLLTSYIAELPFPATIVRGVRNGTDLEAELRFVRFLNEIRPGTNVVWISCEAELQHLSSSGIRELQSIEPSAGDRYLPDAAVIYGSYSAVGGEGR